MHTVGVDLSVTKRRTAAVSIEWNDRHATVGEPVIGIGDEDLASRIGDAEWVGISAPFGWPAVMVGAVEAYLKKGEWPNVDKQAFRYRRTDLAVHEVLLEETGRKVWPLSVSSDGVALTAWKLASVRELVFEKTGRRFDRAGGDGVVEVFPGAALLLWGFERGTYRIGDGALGVEALREAREEFVKSIEVEAQWLTWAPEARRSCIENEDALDALICALVARAACGGLTQRPDSDEEGLAEGEGWVHLPQKGSLPDLLVGKAEMVGAG